MWQCLFYGEDLPYFDAQEVATEMFRLEALTRHELRHIQQHQPRVAVIEMLKVLETKLNAGDDLISFLYSLLRAGQEQTHEFVYYHGKWQTALFIKTSPTYYCRETNSRHSYTYLASSILLYSYSATCYPSYLTDIVTRTAYSDIHNKIQY